MTSEVELRDMVEAWIVDDPDAADRAELRALLDRAIAGAHDAGAAGSGIGLPTGGDAGPAEDGPRAVAELRDRFGGRLEFGTAGLRGVVAAGPNRMNRAVVRAATAAVAGWLLGGSGPSGSEVSVVIGCDARHRSAEFADEAAGVLAGAGITVHMLPLPGPTPLLAFAVRHLAASAGVMITASHNPAADNGYKLYLSDGAQVIPPADAEIEARMAGLGPLSQIPVADADSPLITRHGDEVARAYLDAVVAAAAGESGRAAGRPALTVVYTPLHGVAAGLMLRAIAQAGFAAPHVVAAQAEPDPDFPTVAFPNPEEPGALDLALADARRLGADLVVASDPDGDRLAVAVPEPGGGWRTLTGDQVGALLGASLLERTARDAAPEDRLVASTIVSSTLLSKVAAAAGARYAETLTGFKWIARAADRVPGARFVFGYEEALGYAVGDVVRDKDGIGAALAMLALAAEAKETGRSVLEVYDDLESAHGVHLTSQVTLRTADQATVMGRLRADPPAELGGQPVTGLADLATAPRAGMPAADVMIFRLPGTRVVLRPSGTEPKIKCYIEITEPLAGRSLAAAREAAARRLAPLRSALDAVLAGA
ncbi:MAG TPA: phospho-sugar mutase [Streptosporangiaceae bacterium]|nr:phospho-sugar mutase [Streptosporangiaceae bacterium]